MKEKCRFAIAHSNFDGDLSITISESEGMVSALREFVFKIFDLPDYPCPEELKEQIFDSSIEELKCIVIDCDQNVEIKEI